MPNLIVLVSALVGAIGIFVIFMGLAVGRRAREDSAEMAGRLAQYGVGSVAAGGVPAAPPRNLRERVAAIFQPIADRTGKGNVKKGKKPLAEQLQKADLKLRTSEFVGIQFGCVLLAGFIGLVRFGFGWQMIALAVAGYFAPGFYVRYRMGKRVKAFNDQLGDTLVLLSNALKAGYSFAQAIDTVSKNAVPPISDEFARAVREMNLGGSVEEALNNMLKRIESPDFDLVVTAVAIHRTVGGNLAEILDNIAHTIRERIRIKGEIKTLTAQASASGKLITGLPIALGVFLYFVTPEYFRPMTTNFIGWAMLGVAAFFIFIGNMIISRVVAIEV
jgi:tight adherence protein B